MVVFCFLWNQFCKYVLFILLFLYFFQFVSIFSCWGTMPWKCNVFGCRGNYDNTPYSLSVSASRLKYLKDPRRWIDTTPNNQESLGKLKETHICHHHFDWNWITLQGGGNRQTQSPSIFCGIPKSCLKQSSATTRWAKTVAAETRSAKQKYNKNLTDKIKDFKNFTKQIAKRCRQYTVYQEEKNRFLSLTDCMGQNVYLIHFKEVKLPLEFVFLERAKINGIEVSKKLFPLQKNSLCSKWTQIAKIILVITTYEPMNENLLNGALESLKSMTYFHNSPPFQFIFSELHMLLTVPKGWKKNKVSLILAAKLHSISPAAYKMLGKSRSIVVPSIKAIKLSQCFQYVKSENVAWQTHG